MKKKLDAARPRKARAATKKAATTHSTARKTPKASPALQLRRALHLVLAPQDPEGLMEFKQLPPTFGTEPYGIISFNSVDRSHEVVLTELLKAGGRQIFHRLLLDDVVDNVVDTLSAWPFDCVVLARSAEELRHIGLELLEWSVDHELLKGAEFSDAENLLTINWSLFDDKSIRAEVVGGAIPVDLICPGQPSFSRGLRDLRRMEVKPVKPARAWHVTGIKPPNPRRRETQQTA